MIHGETTAGSHLHRGGWRQCINLRSGALARIARSARRSASARAGCGSHQARRPDQHRGSPISPVERVARCLTPVTSQLAPQIMRAASSAGKTTSGEMPRESMDGTPSGVFAVGSDVSAPDQHPAADSAGRSSCRVCAVPTSASGGCLTVMTSWSGADAADFSPMISQGGPAGGAVLRSVPASGRHDDLSLLLHLTNCKAAGACMT
jgi:hypothetical protein